MANAKPRITSPPKKNNDNSASNVVTDVIVVRDRVSLMLRFSSSGISICLYLRRFSRMRSYTTTVSLME